MMRTLIAVALCLYFGGVAKAQLPPIQVWVYANPGSQQVEPDSVVNVEIGCYTTNPFRYQYDAPGSRWGDGFWDTTFYNYPPGHYWIAVKCTSEPVFDTAGNLVWISHPLVMAEYTGYYSPVIFLDDWELSIP